MNKAKAVETNYFFLSFIKNHVVSSVWHDYKTNTTIACTQLIPKKALCMHIYIEINKKYLRCVLVSSNGLTCISVRSVIYLNDYTMYFRTWCCQSRRPRQ